MSKLGEMIRTTRRSWLAEASLLEVRAGSLPHRGTTIEALMEFRAAVLRAGAALLGYREEEP